MHMVCRHYSTTPTGFWHREWPEGYSLGWGAVSIDVRPYLLWPTKNLARTHERNRHSGSRITGHTSSNFGGIPGCKMQYEAAVNVVPISIETTSLLDPPEYLGLRVDLSEDAMKQERGQCETDSNQSFSMRSFTRPPPETRLPR